MVIMRFEVLVVIFTLATQRAICSSDEVSELHEIQEFLTMCESQMILDNSYKDVVLVLGNTGAGKSTFTQWIAGDDSQLISTEVVEGTGEYVIADNNKISNSTIQSKTIFPDLVVDNTGTAYYDISGFSDTRGIKHDIATSYFIKRIIDHVDNIKILLVVNHSAVRKGVDRLDLIRLLRHFTDLVKNTDRYNNGIGLIVTKVDNNYIVDPNGAITLVSDKAVKLGVAAFLKDVVEDLEDHIESQTASFEDKTFANKTVDLINALLVSDNELYERIALFRRPSGIGPINKMPLLQKAKLLAQTMVTQYLQFIPTQADVFRYTVSDETKNKLHYLLKSLETILEENVKIIANNIFGHYNGLLDKVQHKIQHEIDIHDINTIDFHLATINNEIKLVDAAISEISTLEFSLDINERPQDIPNLINRTLFHLNVKDISQSTLSNILSIANFLDFIQTTSILKFKLNNKPLQQAIHEVRRKLERASIIVKGNHTKLLFEVDNNIKNMIRMSVAEFKDKITNQEKESHEIKELSEQMSNFCNELSQAQNHPNNDALKNLKLGSYKIIIKDYILHKMEKEEYFLYFEQEIDIILKTYLCDSKKWYEFLNVLYNKLSSYEIQKNKGTKKHCEAFHGVNKYENRKVGDTNIDFTLKDCYNELYNAEYDKIKDINLTHIKLKMLQAVTNLTLSNDSFSQNCKGSKLIIRDRFVRLSNININICSPLTALEIFGSEKIFIDTDFDFTGRNIQMTVMTPIWEIIGVRKISLDGSLGKSIWPRKAADNKDGSPGNPGGHAGQFLALGKIFINGENLSIFANGGDGSSGQDGGDGTPGTDAGKLTYNEEYSCDYVFIYCTEQTVQEHHCSNGKDGRLGGPGGKGGDAGIIKIYCNAPFKVISRKGKDGTAGLDGTPGKAGRSSHKQTAHNTKLWLGLFSITLETKVEDQQVFPCRSGQALINTRHPLPTSRPKVEFISSTALNEYNTFLRQNREGTLNKDVLDKSMLLATKTFVMWTVEGSNKC